VKFLKRQAQLESGGEPLNGLAVGSWQLAIGDDNGIIQRQRLETHEPLSLFLSLSWSLLLSQLPTAKFS